MMNVRLENLIKVYGLEYLCELSSKELRGLKGMTRDSLIAIERYRINNK